MTILQLSFPWTLTRSQWVGFLLVAVSRHSSTQHFQARWVQDSPNIGSFNPAQLRSLVWDPFLAVPTSLDQTLDLTWGPSLSPTFTLRCKDLLDMHRKQVDGIVTATRDLAASGSIDPVEEMARDQVIFSKENNFQFSQVFIFQGHKDPIVPWSNAGLIHQFYSEFTQEQNIEEKSDLQATHGMVGPMNKSCPYLWYYHASSSHQTLMDALATRSALTSTSTTATTTGQQPLSRRSSLTFCLPESFILP